MIAPLVVTLQSSSALQVSFTLHSSFAQPVRELTTPPYEVHEEGWGEFDVAIKVLRSSSTGVL